MADDWQDALRDRYAWARRTSFQVGDGWKTLLAETFAQLDAAIAKIPVGDPAFAFVCDEVKAKYGSMRISIMPDVPEVEAICLAAEDRSETICDVCGAAGRVRDGAWVTVRCDEHAGGIATGSAT
jgi:hypothetical protein